MRKVAVLLTVAVSALAPVFNLYAGTLASVTLADTVQVSGTTLTLNGMGLRTKYAFKVYVAGLYVAEKSSDPSTILRADAPKRIVMHFVRNVGKSDITDGFAESFQNNTPDAAKALQPDIDRLFAALDSVKNGDEIVFTYVPGTGTSLALAGQEKLTIAAPAFAEILFSVWLGPKPPNASLKKGILGQ
jgi:chalcone isomerase-like protein